MTTAISGQVGHLYRLANLLINTDSLGRSADDLEKLGLDVRDAASVLEETLYAIVGPMIDDPEPDEEDKKPKAGMMLLYITSAFLFAQYFRILRRVKFSIIRAISAISSIIS